MDGPNFVTYNANQILQKIIDEYNIHEILKVDSEMKHVMKHSRENQETKSENSSAIFMKNHLDILDYVYNQINFKRIIICEPMSMSYQNNIVTLEIDYFTLEPDIKYRDTFVMYNITYVQFNDLYQRFINKFSQTTDWCSKPVILMF